MQYIESPSTNPAWNLALEQYVFDHLPKDEDYFMLWQNDNTVVVGKYQNTDEEINPEIVEKENIHVVRRLSGGGAVYHDLGNLNFTFITDTHKTEDFNFTYFTKPVIQTLARFGIHAKFNGRNDLTIDGAKFSGNSQYSKEGRIMHHGTLLFNSDLGHISEILAYKPEKYKQKGVKSVRSRVANISDFLDKPLSINEFKQALVQEVFKTSSVKTYNLDDKDLEMIETIKSSRYDTWEWNYGASPKFNIKKSKQFSYGGLTLYLNVIQDTIIDLHLCGDFFGNHIENLYELLKNQPYNKEVLEKRLSEKTLENTINGLTPEDLLDLLFN